MVLLVFIFFHSRIVNIQCSISFNRNVLSYSSIVQKFEAGLNKLKSRCGKASFFSGGSKEESVSLNFPAARGCPHPLDPEHLRLSSKISDVWSCLPHIAIPLAIFLFHF